jgi:hypothetical protein
MAESFWQELRASFLNVADPNGAVQGRGDPVGPVVRWRLLGADSRIQQELEGLAVRGSIARGHSRLDGLMEWCNLLLRCFPNNCHAYKQGYAHVFVSWYVIDHFRQVSADLCSLLAEQAADTAEEANESFGSSDVGKKRKDSERRAEITRRCRMRGSDWKDNARLLEVAEAQNSAGTPPPRKYPTWDAFIDALSAGSSTKKNKDAMAACETLKREQYPQKRLR